MTLPNSADVRKAGEQAAGAVNTAIEQVRTPLLAALGAGDLAAKAVADAVNKAKERAESTRTAAADLPADLSGLREKLDPAELRKLIDNYTEAALKLYQKLADQGEDALDKIKTQPQVKKVVEQLEEAIEAAQTRVGGAAGDARALAEDVLAKVTRKTRSVGEKTALTTQKVAAEVAEIIEEAGDDVAHEVRSASRRVANKTAPARKPAVRKTTAPAPKTTK
ncbi:Iron-regulated heparin binding hemagglutinin HbhA (Adhesin) [Alloactinosynnema sp. L-07]|uniref:hypothetical protein n=1 Tax=Alloactinosynnema sp. L-07 TaxID=1653480 RepID=UPI00065F03EC|nr:hypothetical protein [Alloactinosynnema sp. L-07]CRK60273.1 Iron-regulated heparin binding hemagglutinin HbhA (Adhesin) [Alloactinosynnema sp. L-07]